MARTHPLARLSTRLIIASGGPKLMRSCFGFCRPWRSAGHPGSLPQTEAAAVPRRGGRPLYRRTPPPLFFWGRPPPHRPPLLSRRISGLLRLYLLQHGRQPLVVDDRAGLHCLDLVEHLETEHCSVELNREPPVRVIHDLPLLAHQPP